MGELTKSDIREVVEEVACDRFAAADERFRGIDERFAEVDDRFDQLTDQMNDGFDRVLAAIQSITDQQEDDIVAMRGQLRSHNERIARLERLNRLRA